MRRLIAIAFLAGQTLATAGPLDAAPADPLTKIMLFRYGGGDGGERASQFDVFARILRSKAEAMPGLFATLPAANYLAALTITDPLPTPPGNLLAKRQVLKDGQALQLFDGVLEEETNHSFWVTSSAFLGDLGSSDPNLKKEILTLKLKVSAREFSNLNDTHSLVILYALYLDARRSGGSKELQAELLKQAQLVVSDLKSRGDLAADVKLLEAAVDAAALAAGQP
jgi:hypothetical protein